MDEQAAWLRSLPSGLTPYYSHRRVNQEVGIYRGPVLIRSGGEEFKMTGVVSLRWQPRPRVECSATGRLSPLDNLNAVFQAEHTFALPSTDAPIPRPATDLRLRPSKKPWTLSVRADPANVRFASREDLTRVVFHVVNFSHLRGDFIKDENSIHRGRVVFDADPWRIVLDTRLGDERLKDQLENRAGYAFTHVGEIRRLDAGSFTDEEASELLESFNYYMWLGRGRETAPTLPVGFNRLDEPVWTDWNLPLIEPYGSPMTWLDDHFCEGYAASFSLFRNRWADPYWREVLRLALRYYLKANQPDPVQGGIVMGQIALELVAWAVLVVDGASLSKSQWKKLHADDQIRLVLAHFGIPADVPVELEGLVDAANQNGWTDGPAAVAALRNDVVHLRRPRPDHEFRAWIDAWLLTTWYVEMVLLGLIGYTGSYANRLHKGPSVVEPVPWATTNP